MGGLSRCVHKQDGDPSGSPIDRLSFGLIVGKLIRITLLLLVGQTLGAATPLVLFPDVTWSRLLVPTLEGQYILKNIVLVSAALTIGATVRGGLLVDDPEIIEAGRDQRPAG